MLKVFDLRTQSIFYFITSDIRLDHSFPLLQVSRLKFLLIWHWLITPADLSYKSGSNAFLFGSISSLFSRSNDSRLIDEFTSWNFNESGWNQFPSSSFNESSNNDVNDHSEFRGLCMNRVGIDMYVYMHRILSLSLPPLQALITIRLVDRLDLKESTIWDRTSLRQRGGFTLAFIKPQWHQEQ